MNMTCLWILLRHVGSSVLGGIAGLLIGIGLAHGRDSIFPVWQIGGFVAGLVVGPMVLELMRYWKHS
jgi:hypothetical protein